LFDLTPCGRWPRLPDVDFSGVGTLQALLETNPSRLGNAVEFGLDSGAGNLDQAASLQLQQSTSHGALARSDFVRDLNRRQTVIVSLMR
jgi:hypothetical protein